MFNSQITASCSLHLQNKAVSMLSHCLKHMDHKTVAMGFYRVLKLILNIQKCLSNGLTALKNPPLSQTFPTLKRMGCVNFWNFPKTAKLTFASIPSSDWRGVWKWENMQGLRLSFNLFFKCAPVSPYFNNFHSAFKCSYLKQQ